MTWGTKESESKAPPPTYTATTGPATFVPVSSQYSHYPKKSTLAVSSIILISGIFCLLLGIALDCVSRGFLKGPGMGCGVLFIVCGILGIVSVYKRTKGRLVATAVLALLATLAAVWLGCHVSNWYWSNEGYNGDRGMMGGNNGDYPLDRKVRMITPTPRPANSTADEDDHMKKDDSMEKDDGKRGEGYWGYGRYRRYKLGINCFLLFFSLLVFCCSIALNVFALKTVTSPRCGSPQGTYPYATPVIAFPPSKDPNQLDSFNGNDDYI